MEDLLQGLQYSWFKKKFFELSGIDLNSYKDTQMKRRINSYIKNENVKNLVEFYKLLEKDKKILENFKNFLTINVSYFFRDADKWEELEKKYLHQLLSKNRYLKVWCAGCSIGCEPYTVAILLDEYKKRHPFVYSILATDIDIEALNSAQLGLYKDEHLKYLKQDILNKYFIKQQNGEFKITDKIKNSIKFKSHDLLKDEFEEGFNIIICRNVVIYFEEKAKLNLYKKFHSALIPDGILFTGSTEIIFKPETIGLKTLSPSFYQKV